MFTKYTNVKLPQNYSGSRFKTAIDDTEMKTHRATEPASPFTAVKTSVSPYFKNSFLNEQSTRYEVEDEEPNNTEEVKIEAIEKPTESHEDQPVSSPAPLKDLFRLLEGVQGDDLLLLSLIILLASDGGQNSLDTIVILALLLLY